MGRGGYEGNHIKTTNFNFNACDSIVSLHLSTAHAGCI